jgi:hypothetical protein
MGQVAAAGSSRKTTTPEDRMGRIVVTQHLSLDGVIEAPGPKDVEDKGWIFEHPSGEERDRFKLEETLESAALLRADKFNGMPKYAPAP